MTRRFVLALCALSLSGLAMAAGTPAHWITTWAASPLPAGPAMGPVPGSPSFGNQTIRQVLRLSAGGPRLRVKLSNEYGAKPLKIGSATVSLVKPDGSLGPALPLTFAGDGDYAAIEKGDALEIPDLRAQVAAGAARILVRNATGRTTR